MENFNDSYVLLEKMYEDPHYPKYLVDKLKYIMLHFVEYLESDEFVNKENYLQEKCDEMTIEINALQEEFYENDSELDDLAKECILLDITHIINVFNLNIDIYNALREKTW